MKLVSRVVVSIVVALTSAALVTAPVRAAAAPAAVTITGDVRAGAVVTAVADAAVGYQWLRDEMAISGATRSALALTNADIGHRIRVRVTLGDASIVLSPATAPVAKRLLGVQKRPRIKGVRRIERTLTVVPGRWSKKPAVINYRWLRDGTPIKGKKGKKRVYRTSAADFGHRISVRVTAKRANHQRSRLVVGTKNRTIGHRVPVRRTFTYSIATRGTIRANVKQFATVVQKVYNDPRGWRAAGFRFVQVARGGQFTLFLAHAATLPSFGYPCSTMWSCRVGNHVIINQDRWLNASPAWNAAGQSRLLYRHMVVNHETGHWLDHRHRGCGGPGKPAPVMMQQSKGRNGCAFNPFPLPSERWTSR